MRALLRCWQQENLLHPSRDAASVWIRSLEGAGASPATIRVRVAAGRMLYRALRWSAATTTDPFTDVTPPRDPTAAWEKRKPYEPAELEKLLAVAAPRDRALVLVGAHAGLRVAETCALTWSAVDLTGGAIEVKAGKGRKRRRVPLSATLKSALVALGLGAPDERIFALETDSVRDRMERLCRRAQVPYRGYHALRHAAGTRAAREGLGLDGLASFLGHANLDTTRVYLHYADESVARTIGGW